jgi:dolichol-phosphate hexosyltransferase
LIKGFNEPNSTEVLIAALNEEQGVGLTIDEISKSIDPSSIIIVDGHSRDRTAEIAKDHGAGIIFQDGKGKGDAIAKAIECIHPKSSFVVLTDADYTYPAEYLPEMIQILKENPQVGMVCGNRFNGQVDGKALRTQFYFGNRVLAFAHSLLNGVDLKDPLTGLRVIRAQILRDWKVKSKGFDIEVELNRQVGRQGFITIEVPIRYRQRIGEKKLKMKHGATILKRILLETLQ